VGGIFETGKLTLHIVANETSSSIVVGGGRGCASLQI